MKAAETPTPRTVPCCGYEYSDLNYPVFWNPYNAVVQCHNCGETWRPINELATANEKLARLRELAKAALPVDLMSDATEALRAEIGRRKEK